MYGKPYGYFIDKRPRDRNFLHVINRNWGVIYLVRLNSFFKLDKVKFEYKLDNLVADGFIRLYSERGDLYSYWFIESDRVDSRNEFTKIQQYNYMFEKEEWGNEYWNVDKNFRPEYFPRVLIVADDIKKSEKILDCIKIENKHGLEFVLATVNEIKKRLMENWVS